MDHVSPIPVASLPAYYQGRPNTVFIDRYGTKAGRHDVVR